MNDLSPRLKTIADLVPQGSRLTDVGTDHALLVAHLVGAGVCPRAIATDLRAQPLERGRRNALRLGVENVDFRLCDGLDGVSGEETDCVVIAGMGGDTIAGILRRCHWAVTGEKLLLLQPMSSGDSLRRTLAELNLAVRREVLVREEGTLYTVLAVQGRRTQPFECWEAYVSRPMAQEGGELYEEYLAGTLQALRRALDGAQRSKKEIDVSRAAQFRRIIEELEKL